MWFFPKTIYMTYAYMNIGNTDQFVIIGDVTDGKKRMGKNQNEIPDDIPIIWVNII